MAGPGAAAAEDFPRIHLGSQGLKVSAQGLGLIGMTGPSPKPDVDMIRVIRHAVDSGITFLDTSDFYGPFTNEILLGNVDPHATERDLEDEFRMYGTAFHS